ncbi:MAG: DMT family transporter, partial [Lentisphaeria bacterium]
EALHFTYASNVSLVVCLSPLITLLLANLVNREKFTLRIVFGSLIALFGVALVSFNGNVVLNLNPKGDLLSLVAATSWAIYCLLLQKLQTKYDIYVLTRKIFFYGIITLIPFFTSGFYQLHPTLLTNSTVALNLIFLGVIASFICYLCWNSAVKSLGAVITNNYVYIIPLVTLITSAIFLNESLTFLSLFGAFFIILGVFFVQKFKGR